MRWALYVGLCVGLAARGQNLYPDPGFEQTGMAGVARSGQQAGHLKVDSPLHWQPIGGEFVVEPYATYRATAWAKATHDGGQAIALYTYAWDSYVWAFHSQASLANGSDWQQVEVTFCSPYRTIWLHPLALLDIRSGEAWIDDLVIERLQTADETIAALRAKDRLGADEARLLARWEVEQGDLAAAEQVMSRTADRPARADIACVVAKATGDPALRTRMLAAMVLHGAAGYNDGMTRLAEVSAGLDPSQALPALAETVLAHVAEPGAIDGFAAYAEGLAGRADPLGTLSERHGRLRATAEQCRAVSAAAPGNARLAALGVTLAAGLADLERQMHELGKADVRIEGHSVKPDTYAIVVPADPTPQETTAARDLQAHLERITGGVIDLTTPGALGRKTGIFIGRASDADVSGLGAEGLIIRTDGGALHLTGGARRGVLYAVYVFLEEHLGCRWFAPDCATWPMAGRIDVGRLDVRHLPLLEYRATDYPRHRPPEFAVRNRYNGTQINANEAWGGKVSYKGFVHTFNGLVPPEQYFDAHPEYFSEIGGKRLRDYSQLCLTNPDVLRIATETVRRWIDEDPAATIISVSQNDWHNPCDCPACHKLAEDEGSQSGPLLHFVNAIAEAIEGEHPDIIIDTLAYQYTRKPPLHVRPRPNVAVRLCSIECEFNRPLATSPYNATFIDDIRGWNAICDRLHIWDYVINYAHSIQPFPNLRVLQPNIQFFIENGVTGIYEEACYWTPGSEMQELRSWLMAKLLWNPAFDVEKGIDEFCAAYWGAAAPQVRAYLDDIHDLAVSDPEFHMPIYVGVRSPFQTAEALDRYDRLFDEAEASVADDPVRLHRVRVARLAVDYTRVAQSGGQGFRREAEALVPAPAGRSARALERFEQVARAEGITSVSENSGWGALETWLAAQKSSGTPLPLARMFGGGLEADVLPGLGGRLFSLRWADNGQELLQIEEAEGGIDPKVGGYKEFSTPRYQSAGWSEAYEITARGPNTLTVRAKLPTGLTMERTFELDRDEPLLRVRSSLTNTTDQPQRGCIRVHACFRLPDPVRAAIRVGDTATPLAIPAGQTWGELTLGGQAKPAGEWSLVDTVGGTVITNRFDPANVQTCYANWSSADHRGNLELWPAEVELAPGQTVTLAHEYRIERRL